MKQKPPQPERSPELQPETQTESKTEVQPEAEPKQAPEQAPEQALEAVPEAVPEPEPGPDIDALIAEAEQRGYIRGCNERIANLMEQPGLWQSQPPSPQDDNDDILILNNLRPSVWDK